RLHCSTIQEIVLVPSVNTVTRVATKFAAYPRGDQRTCDRLGVASRFGDHTFKEPPQLALIEPRQYGYKHRADAGLSLFLLAQLFVGDAEVPGRVYRLHVGADPGDAQAVPEIAIPLVRCRSTPHAGLRIKAITWR